MSIRIFICIHILRCETVQCRFFYFNTQNRVLIFHHMLPHVVSITHVTLGGAGSVNTTLSDPMPGPGLNATVLFVSGHSNAGVCLYSPGATGRGSKIDGLRLLLLAHTQLTPARSTINDTRTNRRGRISVDGGQNVTALHIPPSVTHHVCWKGLAFESATLDTPRLCDS